VLLVGFVFLGGATFAECPSADLTGDCKVDLEDFAIMASQWLEDGREEVPNVVGMPQSSAEAAITGAGLTVGMVTEEYNDTVPCGDVISQNPVAGVLLLPGGAVDLVVSLGPEVDMTWVSINDPGVPDHEAFNGEMSKYETTNAQYCEYLNAAQASEDITVSGDYVVGTSGPYSGEDYYYLAGTGWPNDGATNGGAARINWTGSSFTVDSGFENHPVTYVSWYGSTAFCNYYGYRLPTEWEWQAVADYNGSYTYGCGTTINNGMANYYGSTYPNDTTVVGAFGTYGYGMCDLAGNVWEWTSSCYYTDCSGGYLVIRGGSWYSYAFGCEVSYRNSHSPYSAYGNDGFRVCR
jgi:hypothetical protein